MLRFDRISRKTSMVVIVRRKKFIEIEDIDEEGRLIVGFNASRLPHIRLVQDQLKYDLEINFEFEGEHLALVRYLDSWLKHLDFSLYASLRPLIITSRLIQHSVHFRCLVLNFTLGDHSLNFDETRMIHLFDYLQTKNDP